MSPQGLALRTLLAGRTRTVLAVLLEGASLCVLDLFAGRLASQRAAVESRTVFGERLGHLSVQLWPGAGMPAPLLDPGQAERALRIIRANRGVAEALPQMHVSGVASTTERSALFSGVGIVPVPPAAPEMLQELPGKLAAANSGGIAITNALAASLGLQSGNSVTLAGAGPDAPSIALQADVVEVVRGPSLLMPLEMAQTLRHTSRTERIVVFLHDPAQLDRRRTELASALRQAGLPAQVRTWHEQSPSWSDQRSESDLAFDSVAGMVFAVIAATIAATMSMNILERRREVGTLRALGMRSSAVFLMFVAEALGMALAGVVLSLVGSGMIAWGVNRASLAGAPVGSHTQAPMVVELDFERMLMAVVAVLAVTLLAALVPAFKAARAPIAPALAA